MIDYRILLKNYMRHVGNCEGNFFVPFDKDNDILVYNDLTKDEIQKLQEIEKELIVENSNEARATWNN